jgi:hypothetical protein
MTVTPAHTARFIPLCRVIYVPRGFQKKSNNGIATPGLEIGRLEVRNKRRHTLRIAI